MGRVRPQALDLSQIVVAIYATFRFQKQLGYPGIDRQFPCRNLFQTPGSFTLYVCGDNAKEKLSSATTHRTTLFPFCATNFLPP